MRSLSLVLLVLVFGCKAVYAADNETSPDFSQYSQSAAVQHYLGIHRAEFHLQFNSFLLITDSISIGGALEYYVTETGGERDSRKVYNFAHEATHHRRLSETELASLRKAIRELPTENALPPLERLVVISFRSGANWMTRNYDREALPVAVRQIYNVIGGRFETKQ